MQLGHRMPQMQNNQQPCQLHPERRCRIKHSPVGMQAVLQPSLKAAKRQMQLQPLRAPMQLSVKVIAMQLPAIMCQPMKLLSRLTAAAAAAAAGLRPLFRHLRCTTTRGMLPVQAARREKMRPCLQQSALQMHMQMRQQAVQQEALLQLPEALRPQLPQKLPPQRRRMATQQPTQVLTQPPS